MIENVIGLSAVVGVITLMLALLLNNELNILTNWYYVIRTLMTVALLSAIVFIISVGLFLVAYL